MLTEARLKRWLDAYGDGWVTQSPAKTLSLFAPDATYMYTPFHRLMRGHDDIRQYVERGAVGLQEDIHFSYELLAVTEAFGIARWKADLIWKATGERLRFDGIYQVFLNEQDLCTEFNEWWHSVPPLPEANAP